MGLKRLLLLLLAALCVASPAHAFTGKKIALVIANGAYADGLLPLENPPIDANLVAQALRREGFAVTLLQDADLEAMKRAVVDHAERLREAGPGAISYIHYSGHGAADANRSDNYIIPVGAAISSELALPTLGYRLSDMVATVEAAKPAISIISIDACRNVAFPHAINRSGTKGLARIDEARGTLIAFATAPGSVAEDGPGEKGSTFSRVLAEEISKGGETHVDVFKNVQIAVSDATNGRQVPWYEDGIVGRFTFQTDGSAPPPTVAKKGPSTTRAAHQVVQQSEAERRARSVEARESLTRMGLKPDGDTFWDAIQNGDNIAISLYVDAGVKLSHKFNHYFDFFDQQNQDTDWDTLVKSGAVPRDPIAACLGGGPFFDKQSWINKKINIKILYYYLCSSPEAVSIYRENLETAEKILSFYVDERGKADLNKCVLNFSSGVGARADEIRDVQTHSPFIGQETKDTFPDISRATFGAETQEQWVRMPGNSIKDTEDDCKKNLPKAEAAFRRLAKYRDDLKKAGINIGDR